MKRFIFFFLSCFAVFSVCVSSISFSEGNERNQEGSVERILSQIDDAYNTGEIDYETALTNKAFAIFEPTRLSSQFQMETYTPSKCATPVVLEIVEAWESLSPRVQNILAVYFQRPYMQHTFNSPSDRF